MFHSVIAVRGHHNQASAEFSRRLGELVRWGAIENASLDSQVFSQFLIAKRWQRLSGFFLPERPIRLARARQWRPLEFRQITQSS